MIHQVGVKQGSGNGLLKKSAMHFIFGCATLLNTLPQREISIHGSILIDLVVPPIRHFMKELRFVITPFFLFGDIAVYAHSVVRLFHSFCTDPGHFK